MRPVPVRGSTQQAKAAYRARVEDLREELEQARDWADHERAARAQEELDFIARELARAVGLGGRDRPTASRPSARARTWAARSARPCARSLRRCRSSARISSAPSARACSAPTVPTPSRPFALLSHAPAPSALPRGTVTFMLTDVEGSTRLFAQHRERRPARSGARRS